MRSLVNIVTVALLGFSALITFGCNPAPSDARASQPAKRDPDRVTKLQLYGNRYAGEPSPDGVEGVTGVELTVGQAFIPELYFAAGTGYAWYARGFDASIAEMSDQRSRPAEGTDAVGSRQLCTMRFTALKPGKTRVTFELKRAWDTTEAPLEVRHTMLYVK